MSHTDPAILALRALGEPAGTAPDEHHLAQCADCQGEVERLTRVVELARQDGPLVLDQPPSGLWEQIAAVLQQDAAGEDAAGKKAAGRKAAGEDRVATPAAAVASRAGAGRARWGHRRLAVALAGLAAGLIVGIGGTAVVAQRTSAPAARVVASVELRPLPQFPQWRDSAGTARLQDNGAAQLLSVAITAPRPPGFYEVWLLGQDGTSMISLGDLNATHTGTFAIPAGADLGFYSRIDVSLQPFNGSTLHSRTSVVRGALPTAATTAGNRT